MEHKIKVHIMGAAAVVVSGIKLEDWELAEKYAPEALKIMNGEGEPVFKVETAKGTGSMNHYGVCWGAGYPTEEGFATVTILIDDEVENKKDAVMDVIGSALLDLAEIENRMPGILEEIREKTKKIGTRITVE